MYIYIWYIYIMQIHAKSAQVGEWALHLNINLNHPPRCQQWLHEGLSNCLVGKALGWLFTCLGVCCRWHFAIPAIVRNHAAGVRGGGLGHQKNQGHPWLKHRCLVGVCLALPHCWRTCTSPTMWNFNLCMFKSQCCLLQVGWSHSCV